MKKTTKTAKDLKVGDRRVFVGMVRYEVVRVTPIGTSGYVEIMSRQVGKPDNVQFDKMPGDYLVEVIQS